MKTVISASLFILWHAVLGWDVFWPSSLSHLLIWVMVPFMAIWWLLRAETTLKRIGVIIVFLGAISNGMAMWTNGGRMPVDHPERVRSLKGDITHGVLTPDTHLQPLCDVIYLKRCSLIASAGDISITAGVMICVIAAFLRKTA